MSDDSDEEIDAEIKALLAESAPAPKAKRKTPADVIAEAHRWHERIREIRRDKQARLAEQFDESIRAGYWPGLSFTLGGFVQECLLEGMGWHVLHGDVSSAREAFAAAHHALPYYRRMHTLRRNAPRTEVRSVEEAKRRAGSDDALFRQLLEEAHRRSVGDARQFEPLLFCLMFANDRASATMVAELLSDGDVFAVNDHFDTFILHMAAMLMGQRSKVQWSDYKQTRGAKNLMINPYRQPLADFAAGDDQAINAAVTAFAAAYAAQGRVRDPAHLAYGASRLGQAISFNAYGTALLKLASWHGVAPCTDSKAHPLAFSA